ncbi:MAG: GAF domain-containing protein [Nocardioides sp.]|uniref:GAF domain-containing sensor histidine kinase n=1 Tax=Nocardioides sp. TaxID=35761 RepID=UPI003F11C2F1
MSESTPPASALFKGRALLDAISAIASDLDLTSVLTHIIEAATALTGAQYGALGVLGSDGDLVEFITTGIDDDLRALIGDLPRGGGILGVIIEQPEGLRLVDLSAHPKSVGFPPNHPPMRSFLGMPVRIRGTVFGNLYLTEKAGGQQFTAEDEQLVAALARAAGYVIGNARDYELSERRRQWLEASAQLQDALQPPVEHDVAMDRFVRTTRRLSRGRAVALLATDTTEADTLAVDPGDVKDVNEALEVLRSSVQMAPHGPVVTTTTGRFHAVVVPLRSPLVPVQALVVLTDREHHPLDINEREMLASFADQAILAIDRAQAISDREEWALTADRERIARDLHDVVIQRLFATGLQLQGVAALAGDARIAERIDRATEDLDATIKAIRGTIFELQHRGSVSLREELRSVVREYVGALGFTPTVTTSGPIDTVVPPELADQVLAVLREAVSNVARHAQAERAAVLVEVTATEVVVQVSDDGIGLPPTLGRESGVHNSRRRARGLGGSLELRAGETCGTVFRWVVPLDDVLPRSATRRVPPARPDGADDRTPLRGVNVD